jgi:3-oxoacyl-[acyl-carrier protein] reductase
MERVVLALAKELGARGVSVNCVAPTPVEDSFYSSAETPGSIEGATRVTG